MPRYLNHYRCDECDVDWTDEWDCACEDDCPVCGDDYEPHHSDEISDEED